MLKEFVKKSKKEKDTRPLNQRKYGKVESLCIFRCNCNCIMCSVANAIERGSLDENKGLKPFKEIKKDIDIAVHAKAHTFAFSGGEPTLRKDLIELVKYAKKRIPNIEIQSNGRLYYYKSYCKELIQAGVNVFVVSFYSTDESIHDKIMGVKGAYKQTIQGLKNLRDLKQEVKINIVILKLNYLHLPELIKFLLKLDVKEFRLIYATIEGNVLKNPKAIVAKMSVVAPYLRKALRIGLKKVPCYVYNMVPCLLPDYEESINDIFQSDTYLRGLDFECSVDENRRKKKVKSNKCEECKYNPYCYGVWKNYAKVFGLRELKPVKD